MTRLCLVFVGVFLGPAASPFLSLRATTTQLSTSFAVATSAATAITHKTIDSGGQSPSPSSHGSMVDPATPRTNDEPIPAADRGCDDATSGSPDGMSDEDKNHKILADGDAGELLSSDASDSSVNSAVSFSSSFGNLASDERQSMPLEGCTKPASMEWIKSKKDKPTTGRVAEYAIDGKESTRWSVRGRKKWLEVGFGGGEGGDDLVEGVAISFFRGDRRVAFFDVRNCVSLVRCTSRRMRYFANACPIVSVGSFFAIQKFMP